MDPYDEYRGPGSPHYGEEPIVNPPWVHDWLHKDPEPDPLDDMDTALQQFDSMIAAGISMEEIKQGMKKSA